MGVILRTHPVRGESHIQHNATERLQHHFGLCHAYKQKVLHTLQA